MALKSSTQAFLTSLIDYAGLFPPSELPLEQAICNFHDYQSNQDAWMLGRFIMPASRLGELQPYVSMFSKNDMLNISALGQRSKDEKSCLEGFYVDLEIITRFCKEYEGKVGIDVLEMPLPPVIPNSQLLKEIGVETKRHGLQTFCEMTLPLDGEWVNNMLRTIDEISEHNRTNDVVLGLKLRTGGVTADAFPTPIQVATALVGCYERKIPLKFTAGLHHPLRMYREEVKANMHGFLNMFTAGMLVNVHRLDIATTAEVLTDEDPSHFRFTDKGLYWKNLFVSQAEIIQIRKQGLCSYGSCSFDEPREGLQLQKII